MLGHLEPDVIEDGIGIRPTQFPHQAIGVQSGVIGPDLVLAIVLLPEAGNGGDVADAILLVRTWSGRADPRVLGIYSGYRAGVVRLAYRPGHRVIGGQRPIRIPPTRRQGLGDDQRIDEGTDDERAGGHNLERFYAR